MAGHEASRPTPLERVASWVEATDDLAFDDQGRVVVAGEPPLVIDVAADDERVMLTHATSISGTPDLPGRASTVRGVVSGESLTLSTGVFLDGLDRQSFTTALRILIDAVDGVLAQAAPSSPTNSKIEEPAPTRELPAVWTPTHAVPAGGIRAWSEPEPSLEPTATLEARVRLSIAEERGSWARVVGSNGWTGWVDARVLEPLDAEHGAPAPVEKTTERSRILRAVGGAAIALSVALPWVRPGGSGSWNAFDVSARFLLDNTASGAPDLAWIILGVAAVALTLAVAKGPTPVTTLIGFAAIGIAGLFAVQLYLGISDTGGTVSDAIDLVGFAPLVAAGGGVVVIAGAKR